MIAASKAEAQAARQGAKAGAKARARESEESASQSEAILSIGADRRSATWTRTYRVDGELRTTQMRETARREVDGAELLRLTREAMRLAAGRLQGRHGIPELSPSERDEYACTLIAKLLEDAGTGRMPERAKLTRAYLVKRIEGLVLNDPDRKHEDAAADGVDPESLAAAAESRARDMHDRHDPMLNRGVDGTWPEVSAACAALESAGESVTQKAARTAAYLVAGGSVRNDWSDVWGTSEGYAATRLVPEGAAQLRAQLSALRQSPLYLAIEQARREDAKADEQDPESARLRLAAILQGSPVDRARELIERRWRVELDPREHSPVKTRVDRRIILRSDRSRTLAEQKAGWTQAPR
jgi:hypothetical protein